MFAQKQGMKKLPITIIERFASFKNDFSSSLAQFSVFFRSDFRSVAQREVKGRALHAGMKRPYSYSDMLGPSTESARLMDNFRVVLAIQKMGPRQERVTS